MSESNEVFDQEPVPADLFSAVAGIIDTDREVFFGGGVRNYDYTTTGVYTNNLIRVLYGGLTDSAEDIVHADVLVTDKYDGSSRQTEVAFMRVGQDLVPLNSHVRRGRVSNVYTLGDDVRVARVTPLEQYMIDRLPDEVMLTRILSDNEADKFVHGDPNLGSTLLNLWHDAVHTALHNVTNAFEDSEEYTKVVGMVLSRDKLTELVDAGLAFIGTYPYILKNRDPDSPFPFDAEVVFEAAAIPALLNAYRVWSDREGVAYKDNPF